MTAALEYHRLLATAAPAELASERAALNNAPRTPLVLVRQAILLSHPERPTNLPRASALLGAVAMQRTPDAIALHPLVRLLSDQLAERQRLEATAERLTLQLERAGQQLKDSQRAGEQLREKLDALTEIERTLPTRPGATSAPEPPTSPRKPPR
ncbi:permease [Aromatoleum sp.]|uniref:permease n=1 Tax=Aromatoleum sp. TaxID=2307007 RepID=UPI002FC9B8E0